VINSTNVLGKHNPRWPTSNAPETIRFPDLRVSEAVNAGDAIRGAFAIVVAWLAGLPRRIGRRLLLILLALAVSLAAGGARTDKADAKFESESPHQRGYGAGFKPGAVAIDPLARWRDRLTASGRRRSPFR